MLEYATTHNDPNGIFSRWLIEGASRANTDNGRAYAQVQVSGGDATVQLHSDAGRTKLIAAGTITGLSGNVTLAEENSSGVSGSVQLTNAGELHADIDLFYADDEDVTTLQKDVADFQTNGNFNGRTGFAEPLARAKRVMDALLNARFPEGWRADSLAPLGEAAARYALFFIYDFLSIKADDPGAHLAARWRREARASLARIRLSVNGQAVTPFIDRS